MPGDAHKCREGPAHKLGGGSSLLLGHREHNIRTGACRWQQGGLRLCATEFDKSTTEQLSVLDPSVLTISA